jgi:hypothetical protein
MRTSMSTGRVQKQKNDLIAAGLDGLQQLLAPADVQNDVVSAVHSVLDYARTLAYDQKADFTYLITVCCKINVCFSSLSTVD